MGINSPGGDDRIELRDDYEMIGGPLPLEIKLLFEKFQEGDVLKVHASVLGLQDVPGALSRGVLCKIDLYQSRSGKYGKFSTLRISPISGGFSFTPRIFKATEFVDAVRKGKIIHTRGNLQGRPGHLRY
jgi:hypothetical protein